MRLPAAHVAAEPGADAEGAEALGAGGETEGVEGPDGSVEAEAELPGFAAPDGEGEAVAVLTAPDEVAPPPPVPASASPG